MTDREALLAAIKANPADDVPRLVYADWLEEHDTPAGRRAAEVIRLCRRWPGDPGSRCEICDWTISAENREQHRTFCKGPNVWQLELQGSPVPFGDRDLATLEYVRLSCGTGAKRVDRNGKRLAEPRAARSWLQGNWKRLVPELLREEAVLAAYPDWHGRHMLYRWLSSDHVRAWVPFERLARSSREWMRIDPLTGKRYVLYTPSVHLTFGRGFVGKARWTAPTLGAEICERLTIDQPQAEMVGPGARPPCDDDERELP